MTTDNNKFSIFPKGYRNQKGQAVLATRPQQAQDIAWAYDYITSVRAQWATETLRSMLETAMVMSPCNGHRLLQQSNIMSSWVMMQITCRTMSLRLNLYDPYEFSDKKTLFDKRPVLYNQYEKEACMKKTININGMMCSHCEMTVKKALEAVDGVISATVSHEKNSAVVELSDDVSDSVLRDAVEAKEYEVTGIE